MNNDSQNDILSISQLQESNQNRNYSLQSQHIQNYSPFRCHAHKFCNKNYLLNNQEQVLKKANLLYASNIFKGSEGQDFPQSQKDEKCNHKGKLGVKAHQNVYSVNSSFKKPKKTKSTSKAQDNLPIIKKQDITEESVDDWIAQSFNQNLISFADPYKKFNAPSTYIKKLKSRYRHQIQSGAWEQLKKTLYFENTEDRRMSVTKNNFKSYKNKHQNYLFECTQLEPQVVKGKNIEEREVSSVQKQVMKNKIKGLLELYIQKCNEYYDKYNNICKSDCKDQSILFKPENIEVNFNNMKKIANGDLNLLEQLITNPFIGKKFDKDRQFKKVLSLKVDRQLKEETEKVDLKNIDKDFYMHIDILEELDKKKNPQSADNTFLRAVNRFINKQEDSAFSCFKQVLKIDKTHYQAIFNMGCINERQHRFETCKKWFQLAELFQINLSKVYFAYALCNYKQKFFQETILNINVALDHVTSDFNRKKYIYLRALAYKQVNNLALAQEDYSLFIEETCPKNFNIFMHFVMVILYSELRKSKVKCDPRTFCEFTTLANQIIDSDSYSQCIQPLISDEELAQKLTKISFFQRFSQKELANQVKNMHVQILKPNQVIFQKNNENEVYIIVEGCMIVYDHTLDFNRPRIISYYGEGDIIGCSEKDNNLSSIPDYWFVTKTKVEMIKMNKEKFNQLWKLQYTNKSKMKIYKLLKDKEQCNIMQNVSELTLFKLVFEEMELIQLDKDELVFNDGECIEKINYIALEKQDGKGIKNVKTLLQKNIDKFEFLKKKIDGFFVILDGTLKVETLHDWVLQENEWHPKDLELYKGSSIGESLLFNTISLSRFGKIKTKTQSTLLFLPREKFHKINQLDIEQMKQNCQESEYFKNMQGKLYKALKENNLEY